MTKRITALLLALLLVIGTVPAPAFAADDGNATEETTQTVCSVCNLADCTATHTQCEKCGNYDCTADHTNWCNTCNVDNCGIDHSAAMEPSDAADSPCVTCGTVNCTADHSNWCDTCKADNCGVDHGAAVNTTVCDVCGNEVCTCETTMETTAPVDNCPYCEETTAEDGTVTHAEGCNTAYAYDGTADVGKYVQLNSEYAYVIVSDGSNQEERSFDREEFASDLIFVITDWKWDPATTALWYQVDAYQGTLPADLPADTWILQNYTNDTAADSLIFVEPEKEAEIRDISDASESGKSAIVSGNIPSDVSLVVTDVAERKLGSEFSITGTIVAALDIRPQYQDGTEWQPIEGNPVIVEISAAPLGLNDGDIVKLHHKHGSTVETYDVYVVINGKITFLTDRFSIYLVEKEFDTQTSTNAQLITSGSTYNMTVGGASQVFYTSGSDDSFPQTTYANGYIYTNYKYYVWSVTDDNGAIDYTVRNWNGQTAGNQVSGYDARIAPWITVTPKRAGTVTLTVKSYYQGWNMNANPQHSPTTTKLSEETLTIVVSEPNTFYVQNQVPESGCLVPKGLESIKGVTYTWTRSDNVQIRLEALNDDGSVNVAKDRGGIINDADNANGLGSTDPITYTVTATLPDGSTKTATYAITYGNEILNPSFEVPDDAKDNWSPPWGGTYGYITNGVPGVHWKTTSPGDAHNIGRDLEFGSASSPHGAVPADGSQYVELNAENYGALYQDILTSPGATLNWQFGHSARSGAPDNNMYVVMAATEYAQSIVDYDDIKNLIRTVKALETTGTTIPKGGAGFEFQYDNNTYYIWNSWTNVVAKTPEQWVTISGSYTVPDNQYLTRLFFVSDPTLENGNSTMGNLIDSVSAGEFMSYTVEYYETNTLVSNKTESGKEISAYTSVSLDNLQGFLNRYQYPFKILVNGKPYSGTVADLQRGLYITDYGKKEGSAATGYDDYDIVVQIYFQVPNVRVTKNVVIQDWDTLPATTKQQLLSTGLSASFLMHTDAESHSKYNDYTASVNITQQSTDSSLSASTSFPIDQKVYGAKYTVTESSATKIEGYELVTTITNGTFMLDATNGPHVVNVVVTNTYYPIGSLMVSKFVDPLLNEAAIIDNEKEFAFTVTLANVPDVQKGPYAYTIKTFAAGAVPSAADPKVESGTKELSTNGTLTFNLKHNQYIVIDGLPTVAYTVTEEDYTQEGYLEADMTGDTGTIARGTVTKVTCYNPLQAFSGKFQITKTVNDLSAHGGAPKQAFKFYVTLNNVAGTDHDGKVFNVTYSCDKNKGTLSNDQLTYTLNGETSAHGLAQTVTLTKNLGSYTFTLDLYDGLTATIEDLPFCAYHITEEDYSTENFGTEWKGNQSGFIGGQKVNGVNPVTTVTCVNTYPVTSGVLEITKKVQKAYARDVIPGDTFTFVVTPADGINLNGIYGLKIGDNETTLRAENNQLTVTIPFTAEELKDLGYNDTVWKDLQITGLPMGTYKVTEAEDTDYEQGTRTQSVTVDSTAGKAEFVNKYKQHLGTLTITKTVNGGSANDTFIFHIKGTDTSNSFIDMDVTITGSGSVTIHDLPMGSYTVTEDTDWSWRYTQTGSNTTDNTITLNDLHANVTFKNVRDTDKWLNFTANMPNVFGKKEDEQEGS